MTTPIKRRPFPIAKPFAQRMVHAYSPAKPSPLSRILMLNSNSLDTPPLSLSNDSTLDAPRLGVVREEEYVSVDAIEDLSDDVFPELPPETPQHQQGRGQGQGKERTSLAAELGVESPPEVIVVEEVAVQPPLKERKTGEMNGRSTTATVRLNGNKPTTSAKGAPAAGSGAGTRKTSSTGLSVPSGAGVKDRPKSRNSSDTATGKSASNGITTGAGGKTLGVEKENGVASRTTKAGVKKTSSSNATASSIARAASTGTATRGATSNKPTTTKSNNTTTTTATTKVKISASSKPGADAMPRRVPKNSVEAPDIIRRKP